MTFLPRAEIAQTTRRALVQAARGERELDLLLRGGSVVNVYTNEILRADVGLFGNRIAVVDVGARMGLCAHEVFEAEGLTLLPGMVDTHAHIESSMVTPANYARAVLPFGTTTVVIDPHEIANVNGRAGVEYMLRASDGLPLRIFLTIPSCVPAVPGVETAGAVFAAADVVEMLTWPRVVGIAELMDYPGLIHQDHRAATIAEAGLAVGAAVEGHAPLVTGRDLNAYVAAGADSDHESRTWREMIEKLRLGMWVYGRECTVRQGAAELARALREVPDAWNVAMCTDDIYPDDLLRHGHLNRGVRRLIEEGIDPILAIRFATLNGAVRYGLHDLGAIAPGKLADIVAVRSLAELQPVAVIAGGCVAVRDGRVMVPIEEPVAPPVGNSVRIGSVDKESFGLSRSDADGDVRVRVIALDERRATHLGEAALPFRNGRLQSPLAEDLVLLSIVPRHGQAHRPSVALLRGLDLRRGAVASTVAHDSHNLIVVGKTPEEMAQAVSAVASMGGGLAAVAEGTVLGTLRCR